MLTVLLIWAYMFFVTLAYAVAFLNICRFYWQVQKGIIFQLPILWVLGLTLVSWLSSGLSLLFRMGLYAHLFVLAGALLSFGIFYEEFVVLIKMNFRRNQWWVLLLALLGVTVVVLHAVTPPSNPDTSLYHAQAIRWIEEYPAVPGLGNLDPRLGANSTWFVLNALFSFSFFKLQSFHIVPSFLFLVSLLYFLDGFRHILKGSVRLSQILKIGFVPFAFYILIDETSSPGTDLPIILYYWVILCLWVESIEKRDNSRPLQFVVFLLSMSVITYKMSGAFIVLIGVYIFIIWLKQKEYHLSVMGMGLAIIILVPWLLRNYVLSGYWLYPEPATSFFSSAVDWKMPIERVLSFKQGVQAWAITPRMTWSEIANLSFQSRLGIWFSHLTTNQKGVFLIAILSPILLLFFFLVSSLTKIRSFSAVPWVVFLMAYLNLFFWLITAPNFRFGYGYVVGVGMIAFLPALAFIFEKFESYRFLLVLFLIIVLSLQQVYVIYGATRDGTQYIRYIILPAPYSQASSYPCKIGGTTIFCAQSWRQCSYDAFPCVAAPLDNVELRGDTFRDGFRWVLSK